MIRAWIIFSTLTLSVLFRLVQPFNGQVGFVFTERMIDKQSWVYYTMEHINALAIASCFLIRDSTPRFIFVVYFYILLADMLHYWLFFRDETVGFNLIKVVIFGLALLWTHLKR